MAYVAASSGCCHCKDYRDIANVPHGTCSLIFTVRGRIGDGFARHASQAGFAAKAAAEAACKKELPA